VTGVVDIGVFSGLSFKLYTSDRSAGALNLFGLRPTVWTEESQTRDRIGQARGIIMEWFGVHDRRAFDMLRQLSQEANIKLVDVAQQVIDTRGPA